MPSPTGPPPSGHSPSGNSPTGPSPTGPSPTGPNPSGPAPTAIDTLLDRLISATEGIRDSARAFAANQVSDLLARRQQLATSLQSALGSDPLTADQLVKLQRATAVGEEARQALLIQRETTRSKLQERLTGRHLNESFKPYRPKKQGRLNVKL